MKKTLSLLLCLMMVLNLFFGLNVSATSPEKGDLAPTGKTATYTVDNFYSLRDLFRSHPEDVTTMYIKLAADISYSGYEQATLETSGTDIVLDLAGYTLSCSDESNNSFHLIHAANGSVTITDSLRYDEAADKWCYGKIDYLYTLPDRDTAVMSGDIIIEGGTIVNRTHSSYGKVNCVYTNAGDYSAGTYINKNYYDGSIKIYGGTLEADHPLYLGYLPGSGIYGGTLNVKNHIAVWISALNSQAVYTSEKIPTVTECKINNASGKDQIAAFQLHIPQSYSSTHTAEQALSVFSGNISEEAVAYIDGKRPYSLNEELGAGTTEVWGPMFSNSFELIVPQTVGQLELTIDEPEPGEKMSYNATAPARAGYDVSYIYAPSSSWKNGVQWTEGVIFSNEFQPGSSFAAGQKYAVFIKVILSDSRKYAFAEESVLTAKINGGNALFYSVGDGSYIVYRTFEVKRRQIDSVALTVNEPVVNASPIYSATAPSGADYAVETSNNSNGFTLGVSWMNGSGAALPSGTKFADGQKYTVLVLVDVLDTVKYEFAAYDNITATINGHTASVIPYSATQYGIYYTYDLSTIISEISLTIQDLIEGDRIQWTATPASATYKINTGSSSTVYSNGIAWYKNGKGITPGSQAYFEAGETYRVSIAVTPAEGYQFAAVGNQTFKVNGETATYNGYTETKRYVSYTFTVKHSIDTVELTIPEPTPGEELSYDVSLPEDAKYYTGGVIGKMWKNGVEWSYKGNPLTVEDHPVAQEGNSYKVCFVVKPTDYDNYQFVAPKDLNVTINGEKVTSVYKGATNGGYYVYYTFTASSAVTIVDSIDLIVPAPEDGEPLSYDVEIVNGSGCVIRDFSDDTIVNGVYWSDKWNDMIRFSPGTIAEGGETYALNVFIQLTNTKKYQFAEQEDMRATINGKTAYAFKASDSNYTINYIFTAYDGNTPTEPDSTEPHGHDTTILLGDADDSGKVNVFDASYIQKAINGTKGYPDYKSMDKNSPAFRTVDVDNNGAVNIFDASIVLKYTTGDKTVAKYGVGTEIEI